MHIQSDKRLKEIYDKFSPPEKLSRKEYMESIHALINLVESKDPYTKRHAVKVSANAGGLARYIGLPERDVEGIKIAGVLHDIGKLGVRSSILLKNSSLTKEEYNEVRKHAQIGADIVKPLKFLDEVISIIKHHHENYDGTGYPDSLKKEEIPLGARVLSVADVYDALTSERAYRKAFSSEEALEIMKKESGKKYDPKILEAFLDYLSHKKEGKK